MLITQQGLDQLKKELEELKSKLPQVIDRLQKAREHGDLTENSEYAAAFEDLNNLNSRIKELENNINHAQIAASPQNQLSGLGSLLVVEVNGIKKEIVLVSSLEADPQQGKISIESPVGSNLLNKKTGDVVKINDTTTYKIISIK